LEKTKTYDCFTTLHSGFLPGQILRCAQDDKTVGVLLRWFFICDLFDLRFGYTHCKPPTGLSS
jgi:hypothetical protein